MKYIMKDNELINHIYNNKYIKYHHHPQPPTRVTKLPRILKTNKSLKP